MAASPPPKHVLVVDDNRTFADTLGMLVTQVLPSATVDVGYDGGQALVRATARPPALILMDLDMPVMNGIDAAVAIRGTLSGRRPYIVGMTGDPRYAMLARDRVAFDKLLIKPVGYEALEALLQSI